MSTSKEIIAKTETYGAHNYHPLPVVLTRGEGVWVWDNEGKKYMDMLSAYSALSHGHRHPRLIKTVVDQCEKLTLTSRAFHNEILGEFYQKLSAITGLPKILPMNSGAEAVETAVKLARKWGYEVKGVEADKAEIIVCQNNFHGRTLTVISFSSEPAYKKGFGPFTPGFQIIEYGDAKALEAAITKNTVAFLVEPIQGEAGILIPPDGYLKTARELCTKNNVLLMADEIQTGLGRTGKMFCCEHDGVTPDVYIMGKALGGGIYPVSAVAATAAVMDVLRPGDHGSTFGGNPLAASIGCTALDILVEDELVARSATQGQKLMEALREIDCKHVAEVRGRGLLVGVDLVPAAGGARRFCEALMHEGMLCKETHESVIRFAPPLTISDEEIDWAVERVEHVLTSL